MPTHYPGTAGSSKLMTQGRIISAAESNKNGTTYRRDARAGYGLECRSNRMG